MRIRSPGREVRAPWISRVISSASVRGPLGARIWWRGRVPPLFANIFPKGDGAEVIMSGSFWWVSPSIEAMSSAEVTR